MPTQSIRPRLLSVLALCGLGTSAGALGLHEDDPKLLDIEPAYVGRGFRAADLARPGGRPLADIALGTSFDSDRVTLLSWVPVGQLSPGATRAMDCWGYTTPAGSEVAIITLSNATVFVDISEPQDPVLIQRIVGPTSNWRDVKVFGEYAYSVSEGGGGIQVFDMTQIDSGVVTQLPSVFTGPGTLDTHNVAIDETSGFLYRAGGGSWGLRIYDLASPQAPAFVAAIDNRYVHDVQVVTYETGPWAGRARSSATRHG